VFPIPGTRTRGRPAISRGAPAAALLMTIAACSAGGDAGTERAAAPGAAAGDSTLGPGPAAPSGPLVRVERLRPDDYLRQERGVGAVYLEGAFEGASSEADTLSVLAAPRGGAAALALLILARDSLTWEYVLEARGPVAEGAAVEFGYEEVGLPVLELRGGADPEWLHVRYATGSGGEPMTGWVGFEPGRTGYLPWSDRLAEVPLFFVDPDSVGFFEAPEGAEASVALAPDDPPDRFDYILYPLARRGPWIRVELVTPSDYCFDPPEPRRDTLWIRHLDGAGRPRVWYHTRGC